MTGMNININCTLLKVEFIFQLYQYIIVNCEIRFRWTVIRRGTLISKEWYFEFSIQIKCCKISLTSQIGRLLLHLVCVVYIAGLSPAFLRV